MQSGSVALADDQLRREQSNQEAVHRRAVNTINNRGSSHSAGISSTQTAGHVARADSGNVITSAGTCTSSRDSIAHDSTTAPSTTGADTHSSDIHEKRDHRHVDNYSANTANSTRSTDTRPQTTTEVAAVGVGLKLDYSKEGSRSTGFSVGGIPPGRPISTAVEQQPEDISHSDSGSKSQGKQRRERTSRSESREPIGNPRVGSRSQERIVQDSRRGFKEEGSSPRKGASSGPSDIGRGRSRSRQGPQGSSGGVSSPQEGGTSAASAIEEELRQAVRGELRRDERPGPSRSTRDHQHFQSSPENHQFHPRSSNRDHPGEHRQDLSGSHRDDNKKIGETTVQGYSRTPTRSNKHPSSNPGRLDRHPTSTPSSSGIGGSKGKQPSQWGNPTDQSCYHSSQLRSQANVSNSARARNHDQGQTNTGRKERGSKRSPGLDLTQPPGTVGGVYDQSVDRSDHNNIRPSNNAASCTSGSIVGQSSETGGDTSIDRDLYSIGSPRNIGSVSVQHSLDSVRTQSLDRRGRLFEKRRHQHHASPTEGGSDRPRTPSEPVERYVPSGSAQPVSSKTQSLDRRGRLFEKKRPQSSRLDSRDGSRDRGVVQKSYERRDEGSNNRGHSLDRAGIEQTRHPTDSPTRDSGDPVILKSNRHTEVGHLGKQRAPINQSEVHVRACSEDRSVKKLRDPDQPIRTNSDIAPHVRNNKSSGNRTSSKTEKSSRRSQSQECWAYQVRGERERVTSPVPGHLAVQVDSPRRSGGSKSGSSSSPGAPKETGESDIVSGLSKEDLGRELEYFNSALQEKTLKEYTAGEGRNLGPFKKSSKSSVHPESSETGPTSSPRGRDSQGIERGRSGRLSSSSRKGEGRSGLGGSQESKRRQKSSPSEEGKSREKVDLGIARSPSLSPQTSLRKNTFGLPRRSLSHLSLLGSQSPRGSVDAAASQERGETLLASGSFPSSPESNLGSQPKIVKYHLKTDLRKHRGLSKSHSDLHRAGSKREGSFFRKIGSQLDLRILKALSPKKGSRATREPSADREKTPDASAGTPVGEHRPQIRSPSYRAPGERSPAISPSAEKPQEKSIFASSTEETSTDLEMYRRVTSSYHREFDDIRSRRSFDLGRPDRPQSALFISQGDLPDFADGAGGGFRPRSESDFDVSKLAAFNRSRSGDRDDASSTRSNSPVGLRAAGSPVANRKGRDRRSKQQKMLSSGGNIVKMPRQPRPKRMITILDFLKKGVYNCVELHRRKLDKMKSHLRDGQSQGRTRQGIHYNLEKQMKSTERHLRKLEFHLAKVEELQEHYEKELKLREGAENILQAFSDANSSKAKGSVSETKQRLKDCTQNMCHLEAELEVNLGVFIMKIEGIAGFARVCRGDVFEISFKYGLQKWKSKCKVEKDLSQTWENAEVMFFPMLADFLQIKVTEIRGIARSNIIIGSLEFDTSDFYQAEPQNLTIDVNEAGTIKLNVVISWSPFQIVEEDLKNLNKNSYGKRERAYTESSIQSYSRPQSSVISPSHRPVLSPTPSSIQPLERLDLDDVPMLTLAEALHNVNRLLEILNGQYVELRSLEKQVASLESYLKKKSDIERQESVASLSIKNALDSFNFLDEVDEGLSDGEGDLTEETNRQNLDDSKNPVPKSKSLDHLQITSNGKTDKDGPASISASRPELRLAQRQDRPSGKRSSRFLDLSEKRESRMLEVNEQRSSGLLDSPTTIDSSFGSLGRSSGPGDPEPLSTGSEPIDMALVQHLMYTEYQLSHLGAFGPLKLKETIALDKLQKQAVIIEQLVMLSSSGDELARADDILPELKLNPALLEFWEQCSEKHSLYVNADLFLLQLDVKFGVKLRTNHPDIADDVFQSLGHRIIERPIDLLDPKATITLFQYITFFAQEDRKNPERFISDLTNEFELTASLEPGNPDLAKIVKKLPKGVLLPTGNLRALSLLLLEESDTIKNGVITYLESICNNTKLRQKAIHVYSECLEERDLSLRQAGCVALAAMKARESLEQLVYLLRCDMDDVKQTAKEALMTFGEEGRQACRSWNVQPYHQTHLQPPPQRSDGPLLTTEL